MKSIASATKFTASKRSGVLVANRASASALASICGSLGIKVITAASQLALPWLLLPTDLGLAATASAILGILSLLQTGGLHVVLVRQRGNYFRIGGQAFYLAILLNSVLAIGLCLCAPFIGMYYHDSRVGWMVAILAGILPIQQFGLIESVWLVRHMRHGSIAAINIFQAAVQATGAIALAISGAGPFSLVVPNLVAVAVRVGMVRRLVPGVVLPRMDSREWSSLWWNSIWLNLGSFFSGLSQHGPVLILGPFLSPGVLGLYSWGVNLASQLPHVLCGNLAGVFLPVFARLQRDGRELMPMYGRGVRLLSLPTALICVLQSVLVGDVIGVVFADTWLPAKEVIFWISLSLVAMPSSITAQSLITAQGRYPLLVLSLAGLALLVCTSALAVYFSASLSSIAASISLGTICGSVLLNFVAMLPWQASLLHSCRLVLTPYVWALPSLIVGLVVAQRTAELAWPLHLALSGMGIVSTYCLTVWLLAREVVVDTHKQFWTAVPNLKRVFR